MILVCGASGTVGSALLRELRSKRCPVRGAYHSKRSVPQVATEDASAVQIDLSEPATLRPALEGVDAVFLLSATGPEQTRQELNMVAAAKTAGVNRIVKLSVWRADERLTPIARLHRPVEEALQASGLAWTLLRPNFYMQNFIRQMGAAIKSEGMIAQPATNAAISFVDARDVARVAAQVLITDDHAEQTYALTGPQALSYDQAAEIFSTALQKRVRFVGLSDDQAKADMMRRGLSGPYADALLAVSRAYRNGGAEAVLPTVHDLTGDGPTTFEQFVREHTDALR